MDDKNTCSAACRSYSIDPLQDSETIRCGNRRPLDETILHINVNKSSSLWNNLKVDQRPPPLPKERIISEEISCGKRGEYPAGNPV